MFIKVETHVRQGAGEMYEWAGARLLWATVFFGLSCYLGESLGPTKIAATIFRARGLMGSGRALSNDRIRPHCARSMTRDLSRSVSKDRDDNSSYR
jgi:hypothetical protein